VVFGEPFVLFNFGVSATAMPVPGGDANTGMSFHMYTVDPAKEPSVLRNAVAWSAGSGGALLNTEWGATTNTDAVARQVGELDAALVPWVFWSYCCEVVHSLAAPPAGANLVSPTLDALVEPYPLGVAGTPEGLSYDRASRTLTFTWSTARAGGGSFPRGTVTSIVVPPFVYRGGYRASADGGSIVSACGASEVAVRAADGASSVTVTIAAGACG
jgi:endoglycosylceramidase